MDEKKGSFSGLQSARTNKEETNESKAVGEDSSPCGPLPIPQQEQEHIKAKIKVFDTNSIAAVKTFFCC